MGGRQEMELERGKDEIGRRRGGMMRRRMYWRKKGRQGQKGEGSEENGQGSYVGRGGGSRL